MRLILTTLLLAFLCACKSTKIPPAPDPRAAVLPSTNTFRVFWDPSTTPNVTYRVYYGSSPRTYNNTVLAGTNLTVTVSNAISGATYYVTATALDTTGLESGYSNEAVYTVPTPPLPPNNIRVTFQLLASERPDGPFVEVPGAVWTVDREELPEEFYRFVITTQETP